ncbi:hypothetical protein SHKM778_52300 [Streptomyces sp. KM77-8]|uniref:Uncharacterized protein n=1 Tax=Streptomyces haneummycinicus TaxID=3074435 RepID=A0AAT9HN29_9ACTN
MAAARTGAHQRAEPVRGLTGAARTEVGAGRGPLGERRGLCQSVPAGGAQGRLDMVGDDVPLPSMDAASASTAWWWAAVLRCPVRDAVRSPSSAWVRASWWRPARSSA